jgi:hypothetical protein
MKALKDNTALEMALCADEHSWLRSWGGQGQWIQVGLRILNREQVARHGFGFHGQGKSASNPAVPWTAGFAR